MKNDRFLNGILIFIAALVVLAIVLFLVRSSGESYIAEDTPEGVLHNYALAVQNMDTERAYTYLAEDDAKPAYDAFLQAFLTNQIDPGSSALQIGAVHYDDSGEIAWVEVTVLHAGSGLFDSGWNSSDKGSLILQDGGWKITYLPYPYWGWDWYSQPGKSLNAP